MDYFCYRQCNHEHVETTPELSKLGLPNSELSEYFINVFGLIPRMQKDLLLKFETGDLYFQGVYTINR
jgi:hypothetical protein